MFEKEKEYQYIQYLEKNIIFVYVVVMLLFTLMFATLFKGLGLIIGLVLGYFIAKNYTISTKIKIQEMKWRIDIHNKIMYKEKECL